MLKLPLFPGSSQPSQTNPLPDALPAVAVMTGLEAAPALRLLLEGRLRPLNEAQTETEGRLRNQASEAILHELDRQGLHARWCQVEAIDYPLLELPTLAQWPGDRFLCLEAHTPQGLSCRGEEGTTILRAEELAHLCSSVLDLSPALPPGTLWQKLGAMILEQRKALMPILGLAVFSQILGLLTPQLTRLLVDQAFPQGAQSLFLILILATLAQGFQQAWLGWLQARFVLVMETRLGYALERGLFAHLLRLPFAFLSRRSVGDLMQGFYGLTQAQEFLTGQVMASLLANLTAVAYLVFMARLMLPATLVVVAVGFLYSGVAILVAKRQVRLQTMAVAAQAQERSFLVEMLNGLSVLKACGAEARAETKWTKLYRRRRGLGLFSQQFSLSAMGALNLGQSLFTQGLTIWGGLMVIQGSLQIGELLAFIMMAASFQSALQGLGNLYVQLMTMKPQMAKVREILEVDPVPPPPAIPFHMDRPATLRIRDLWFRYTPESPWVFEGLNLDVEPGEKVLVYGPSGYGKSTLLKLAAGLYTPDRGEITLDGLAPDRARSALAYLPQSVTLFSSSMIENLRLLSGGASREQLLEAAHQTGLDELIRALPMGVETLISARGINFSGGQRQLIALTAVLASDRQILLLDEAMANLDHIRKARLYKLPHFLERTVLFASHEATHGELLPAGARRLAIGTLPEPSPLQRSVLNT